MHVYESTGVESRTVRMCRKLLMVLPMKKGERVGKTY
jgi:hypothetical protein